MNYQTSALWFYKPFYYLASLLCLGLTFFGLSSPLFYLMTVGLVFPVLVSMRLHTLSEAGNAWLIRDRENWLVYVNGIPVNEQRSTLQNPCFATPERLKQFYMRCFSGKFIVQLLAIALLWTQWHGAQWLSVRTAMASIILGLLLWLMKSTLDTLRKINAHQWEIQATTSVGGQEWYQAFFSDGKQAQSALGKLCSVV